MNADLSAPAEISRRNRRRTLAMLARELFGYALVSALALAFDSALLWAFVSNGIHYVFAASLSFTAGGFVAWWLSSQYVFHSHRVNRPGREFVLFLLLGCIGLSINALVIFACVQDFGWSLPAAKISASGMTFLSNFVLRRFALFTPPRQHVA